MYCLYKPGSFLLKIASHTTRNILGYAAISATIFLLLSCFLKQDRTTTVYGTITDQDGKPVDSILIMSQGSKYVDYEIFDQTYTDDMGNYELVADVPKKSHSVNVVIPFSRDENLQFQRDFKDYIIFKNETRTYNCCGLDIGEKTRYDFQLIPR